MIPRQPPFVHETSAGNTRARAKSKEVGGRVGSKNVI